MNRLYDKKRHLVKRVQSDSLGAPGRRDRFYCENCSATAQDVLELIGKVCTPPKKRPPQLSQTEREARAYSRNPYAKCQEAI